MHSEKTINIKSTTNSDALLGIVRHLPHGICHFDTDDCVLFVNQTFESLFGFASSFNCVHLPRRELIDRMPDSELKSTFEVVTKTPASFDKANATCTEIEGQHVMLSCEEIPPHGFAVFLEAVEPPQATSHPGLSTNVDSLTLTLNREGFLKRLASECDAAVRSGGELALLYLDLDLFKHINDTYGHDAGDQVLVCVARRIEAELRQTDVLARLGGDEFAVIQVGAQHPRGSRVLAQRIIETVDKPIPVNDHTVRIGVSVGISVTPFDTETADDLVKMADLAMYAAKDAGRNQMRFFEPAMNERMVARQKLEMDLLRGLEHDEFELIYQPEKNMESGEIVCAEALLTWNHPTLGCISPEDFLATAEANGMIVQLGEWVLKQACKDAVHWPETVGVAVNVSAVQLRDRSFAMTVIKALHEAGLPETRLELEVTETTLITGGELTKSILKDLNSLGIRIALDNFGSGYSSFNLIRHFPFDKVKIDQSFVSGAELDSESATLIHLITAMGNRLSVATTAQGVETESEIEMVRQAGCLQIQGRALSKPIPQDALVGLFGN